MGLSVELRDRTGKTVKGLPDPSGGTFDAAGDFDRLLACGLELSLLASIDPYDDTVLPSSEMPALLLEIDAATPMAKDGAEQRGLLRLRRLALRCQEDDRSTLVFVGD